MIGIGLQMHRSFVRSKALLYDLLKCVAFSRYRRHCKST